MSGKTIDCRGMVCPKPIIETKKSLNDLPLGDTLRIILDNAASKNNVERFLSDNGYASTCVEQDGIFTITTAKTHDGPPATAERDAAEQRLYTCDLAMTKKPPGTVVVLAGERMGEGSEELGDILMKAFVNTIKEATPLPSHVIMYNSGVLLATEGSSVVDSIKEMEKKRVTILVCGTCLNYFGKQESIRAGTISNMYTILEALSSASKIIRP